MQQLQYIRYLRLNELSKDKVTVASSAGVVLPLIILICLKFESYGGYLETFGDLSGQIDVSRFTWIAFNTAHLI